MHATATDLARATPVTRDRYVDFLRIAWHLSAMLIAVVLLYPLGFPQPEVGTALSWATRPLWILCGTIPLVALVALFGRFERPPPSSFVVKPRAGTVLAVVGCALLAVGVSGIATGTLGNLVHGTSRLVIVDIVPLQAFTLAAGGWLVLRASVSQRSDLDRPEPERRVSSSPLPGA
jgi:hypothetical protein